MSERTLTIHALRKRGACHLGMRIEALETHLDREIGEMEPIPLRDWFAVTPRLVDRVWALRCFEDGPQVAVTLALHCLEARSQRPEQAPLRAMLETASLYFETGRRPVMFKRARARAERDYPEHTFLGWTLAAVQAYRRDTEQSRYSALACVNLAFSGVKEYDYSVINPYDARVFLNELLEME
jgi:hypothetical protein